MTTSSNVQQLKNGIRVESCFDKATSQLRLALTIELEDDQENPWVAIGHLPTDECLMTPRGVDSSEAFYAWSDAAEESIYKVGFGAVPRSLRWHQGEDEFRANLTLLAELEGSDGSIDVVNG